MPQRNHVLFDSLGNKGLFFGDRARWALLAGRDGLFKMQPVAPHSHPDNTLVSVDEFKSIGDPVVMQFEKPETIDSLIMQLKCQRQRLQMEIDAKAKEKSKKAQDHADSILARPLSYQKMCLLTIEGYLPHMEVGKALEFLNLPSDFYATLSKSVSAEEATAKPRMTIEEMAACDVLGVTPDFYQHLRKSVEQAGK